MSLLRELIDVAFNHFELLIFSFGLCLIIIFGMTIFYQQKTINKLKEEIKLLKWFDN